MSIEQLIRDLILEDQFKAKYTSRQRTIFCDNMYAKVSAFVEKTNKDRIERIEELEEQLEVAENDRDFYKEEIEYYKEENKELNKTYKAVFMDTMAALRIAICLMYLYAIWQYYNDKAERSINDTNTTSDAPYSIE